MRKGNEKDKERKVEVRERRRRNQLGMRGSCKEKEREGKNRANKG